VATFSTSGKAPSGAGGTREIDRGRVDRGGGSRWRRQVGQLDALAPDEGEMLGPAFGPNAVDQPGKLIQPPVIDRPCRGESERHAMDADRNFSSEGPQRPLGAARLEEHTFGNDLDQIDALARRENRGRQLWMPGQADAVRHQLPHPPQPPPHPPPPHEDPHDEPDPDPHDEPDVEPQELADRGRCGLRNSLSSGREPSARPTQRGSPPRTRHGGTRSSGNRSADPRTIPAARRDAAGPEPQPSRRRRARNRRPGTRDHADQTG
jgi:hypothetical protein